VTLAALGRDDKLDLHVMGRGLGSEATLSNRTNAVRIGYLVLVPFS